MSDAYRDGEEGMRARLDDLAWQRDVLIDRRLETERELARIQQEIATVQASLDLGGRAKQGSGRWVLIVLAVPAAVAGGLWLTAWLCFPPFTHCRLHATQVGAGAVKQAAELFVNMEDAPSCPTIENLIAAKKLDPRKADDSWGRPYHISCSGDDIRVRSAGKDGRFWTGDDIRDDFKPSDLKRVSDQASP